MKLKPDADLDELKLAYRKRVKSWHPDKFPSSSERLQKMAHDKLHEVNVAYQHLKKPRPHDEMDFRRVLPVLTAADRNWLRGALEGLYPGHAWAVSIDGERAT